MAELEKFRNELAGIRNIEVRDFVTECLIKAPEHFWHRPSSSTGKHHLRDEFSEGGNVKHTKRVCSVAEILIRAWPCSVNIDAIRGACILHDICKYGDGLPGTEYTAENHPQLAAGLIKKIPGPIPYKGLIVNAVESHMGKWGVKKPISVEGWIVHFADVIATNYVP